jgi:type I restriction enzyme S subunit
MPVIRMGNVDVTGRLSLADLKYVVLPEAEQRKYALETGDILFNRTNSKELVGKTGIWRPSEPAVAASYFIRVRVNEDTILPDYFWAFMNTRHMKSVLYSTARGAIGQSNINAQELRALAIPCPPTSLQQTFARRTAEALDLEGQQGLASETARTVFQALLAGVFHQ